MITYLPANKCVSWFLVHSYLYYRLDRAEITDSEFDQLCQRLIKEWDEIDHNHKGLIDIEALKAGSGFYLTEDDYPLIVKNIAHRIQNGDKDFIQPFTDPGWTPSPGGTPSQPAQGEPKDSPPLRVEDLLKPFK